MIVLSGKTCSGKNFIRDMLRDEGINPVVTYTTRPMRKGEEEGKTYHYLSKEDFKKKIDDNFFVEFVSYNAANGETWFYGSHFDKEDDNKVIILNPDGIEALKNSSNLEVTPVVFYIDAAESVIKERALKRGDHPQQVEQRLKIDEVDFKGMHEKADLVIKNDGVLKPEELIKSILTFHNNILKQPSIEPWKAPSAFEKRTLSPKQFNMDMNI